MPTYLLPCHCGKPVRVEPYQAGDRVSCECGRTLDVPPLTRLRELPTAPEATDERAGGGWGFSQGVATASLLACLALAALGGYFWRLEPAPPQEFTAAEWEARSADVIASWTPQECMKYWWLHYRPLATEPLQEIETDNPRLAKTAEFYRLARFAAWGLAAVAAVVGIAAASGGSRASVSS